MATALEESWLGTDEPTADEALCEAAAAGDAEALERLVRRHQRFVYNLALRLVLSPADADDLSQEALVRIITRLSQFRGDSSFRTWAYRIVVRCFLDGKRRKMEQAITSFDDYGEELDRLPLTELDASTPERALLVEEAKVGCMLGMLLCLDREQRVAYVLGEIVGAHSEVAAAILDISRSAFRKRLERARRDLTAFMNDKCGLVNEQNPCRCSRKTHAFIEEGWVDPARLKFTGEHVRRLKVLATERAGDLCELEAQAATLFREHPLLEGPDLASRVGALLDDLEPELLA